LTVSGVYRFSNGRLLSLVEILNIVYIILKMGILKQKHYDDYKILEKSIEIFDELN